MKKFINDVDNLLSESLQGFASAHSDLVSLNLDPNYLTRANKAKNKVALISGGGSGHEPLHTGFVGYGMLDAACPGHVFTSPTPDQMIAAAEAVECGKGVLFIVKNYAGDVMNFEMAAEILPLENAIVLTNDDAAVINSSYTTGRRGVAGTVIVEKVVGSLAETGAVSFMFDRVGVIEFDAKVANEDQMMEAAIEANSHLGLRRVCLAAQTIDIGDVEIDRLFTQHVETGVNAGFEHRDMRGRR